MSERNGYPHGVPGWVDIGTDVEAAKTFYGGLFGWSAVDAGPPEQTGGYGFFAKGDKLVAGYGPQQNPGPPFWSTYVMVDDADAVAAAVGEHGGAVVVPPMDVMTAGRMAVFQDPQGAFFSVWQSGEHQGAQVVNEPGALSWNELNTTDAAGAAAFYTAVFGWEAKASGDGDGSYTEWKVDGRSVGGMMAMPPGMAEHVPPHWLVYFAVDDVAAATSTVGRLGGTVVMSDIDTPAGPVAVVSDPQGAMFAVIRLTQPDL